LRTLWRISNHGDLAGLGGEKSDGRWHTAAPGKRIVYVSEHPAVALLEALANLKGNPALFPERYQLIEVQVPDGVHAAAATLTDSKGNAFDLNAAQQATRRAGDEWLRSKVSALAQVPAFPSPRSINLLLNPLHPDAAKAAIASRTWIKYDKRLFHAGPDPR